MRYYTILLSMILLFSCSSENKKEDIKSEEQIVEVKTIPNDVVKENVTKRFTNSFPQAVFNTKEDFTIKVENEGEVTITCFSISEHYDYKSDEKLKLRMVVESIKLFDKVDGVSKVTLGVRFNKKSQPEGKLYIVNISKSDVEDYIKNIGQRGNDEVLNLFNKYGYFG